MPPTYHARYEQKLSGVGYGVPLWQAEPYVAEDEVRIEGFAYVLYVHCVLWTDSGEVMKVSYG